MCSKTIAVSRVDPPYENDDLTLHVGLKSKAPNFYKVVTTVCEWYNPEIIATSLLCVCVCGLSF